MRRRFEAWLYVLIREAFAEALDQHDRKKARDAKLIARTVASDPAAWQSAVKR